MRRRGLVVDDDVENGDASDAAGGGMDVDDDDGLRSNNNCSTNSSQQLQQSLPQPIELVVCSPLTRCLQTASHIFPSYFKSVASSEQQSVSTMTGIIEEEDEHRVLDRNCRVCCHGDVREAYGMHYPDKRSSLSQLKSKFPTVTYHPSLTEHDTDWQPNTRETHQDVSRRIHNFFTWLMQQPHDNTAIVTHGVWMECALLDYFPEVLEFGKKRVYNCEVYSGKLSLVVGSLVVDGNNGDGNSVVLKDVEQMSFYHV